MMSGTYPAPILSHYLAIEFLTQFENLSLNNLTRVFLSRFLAPGNADGLQLDAVLS